MADDVTPSPFVPGSLPGLLDGWCPSFPFAVRLDLRRTECRDRVARWMAQVLGVPVGVTAQAWGEWWRVNDRAKWHFELGRGMTGDEFWPADPGDGLSTGRYIVPALASIPLDSPDRDALAMAAVARWLGDEIRAGRIMLKAAP